MTSDQTFVWLPPQLLCNEVGNDDIQDGIANQIIYEKPPNQLPAVLLKEESETGTGPLPTRHRVGSGKRHVQVSLDLLDAVPKAPKNPRP